VPGNTQSLWVDTREYFLLLGRNREYFQLPDRDKRELPDTSNWSDTWEYLEAPAMNQRARQAPGQVQRGVLLASD
jgi:hypothetical protein